MEIITLLGVILDRLAFPNDLSWECNEDSSISITLEATPELQNYAESLLENDDYIEIERDDYDFIRVVFENKRISKVCFGNEVHNAKECIERYVNEWQIEDIYIIMCLKIITLLMAQN